VKCPPFYTPTESSFKILHLGQPAMIDIPPRSPTPLPPKPSPTLPTEQLPSRPQSRLNSADPGHMDFHFPRRQSTKKFLSSMTPDISQTPTRLAPHPPLAPQMISLPMSPTVASVMEASPTSPSNPRSSTSPATVKEYQALKPTYPKRRSSMQVRANLSPPLSFNSFHSPRKSTDICLPLQKPQNIPHIKHKPALSLPSSAPAPTSVPSPSIQRPKTQNKTLGNRRSMPHLANGPPPAPPPSCALPPLPGIRGASTLSMGSQLNGRSSVRA